MIDKRCPFGLHDWTWQGLGQNPEWKCRNCGVGGWDCDECGGLGETKDFDDCPAAGCVDGVVEINNEREGDETE